jgi:hypothetical protein
MSKPKEFARFLGVMESAVYKIFLLVLVRLDSIARTSQDTLRSANNVSRVRYNYVRSLRLQVSRPA